MIQFLKKAVLTVLACVGLLGAPHVGSPSSATDETHADASDTVDELSRRGGVLLGLFRNVSAQPTETLVATAGGTAAYLGAPSFDCLASQDAGAFLVLLGAAGLVLLYRGGVFCANWLAGRWPAVRSTPPPWRRRRRHRQRRRRRGNARARPRKRRVHG